MKVSSRPNRRLRRGMRLASIGAGAMAFFATTSGAMAATKTYVVSWFFMATYSQDGDCADGLNPSTEQNFRRILAEMGKSPAEIEGLVKAMPGSMYANIGMRGRVDGKPVSPYLYPTATPDPHIKTVTGKVGYGFNLDGRDGPNDFVDPESGERGVDNQLYRVLGCFVPDRAFPPDRPGYPATMWDMPRDAMPAWVIEISGIDDASKAGDVTVGIYRATAPITRDTAGQPIADMTYRISDDPRSHNVVHGHLDNGVVVTDKFAFNMLGDVFFQPEFHFKDAKLRLTLKPDGTADGILGGYQDWKSIYWSYALGGVFNEAVVSLDAPGIYYALKRMADAYPDPKTGENTAISTAYKVEAIPAFIIHSGKTPEKTAATESATGSP